MIILARFYVLQCLHYYKNIWSETDKCGILNNFDTINSPLPCLYPLYLLDLDPKSFINSERSHNLKKKITCIRPHILLYYSKGRDT